MRALTLYQPYASLIAIGAKQYETRAWAIGDWPVPIAIHAGKIQPGKKKQEVADLFWDRYFTEVLQEAGYHTPDELPSGAVVCIATVEDCILITDKNRHDIPMRTPEEWLSFGDFAEGRYAWKLSNVRRIEPPIVARGYQNIWEWDAPPEVLALL